jgi:hypothetical protein
MSSLQRRPSVLSKLDDGLLVAAIVVGVIVAFWVVMAVLHTIFWLAKLAIIGLVIGLAFNFVTKRNR